MERIDQLIESNKEKALIALRKLHANGGSNDAEVLWRLARVLYYLAVNFEKKEGRQKGMIFEAREYGLKAAELAPSSMEALRWAAIITGACIDYLSMKEKIEQGYVFKSLLDKALALNASDFGILHMRGRFAYSVAELTWIERKIASTIFATSPTATFDEALRDFLAANELKPSWIENLFFVGKCYIALKDTAKAASIFDEMLKLTPNDFREKSCLENAESLIKKHSK